MTLPTPLTFPTLTRALKLIFASKQFGSEHILAALVAEAVLAVMPAREMCFVLIMSGALRVFFYPFFLFSLVCGDES
jgi:hypothetical protein